MFNGNYSNVYPSNQQCLQHNMVQHICNKHPLAIRALVLFILPSFNWAQTNFKCPITWHLLAHILHALFNGTSSNQYNLLHDPWKDLWTSKHHFMFTLLIWIVSKTFVVGFSLLSSSFSLSFFLSGWVHSCS